MINANSKIAKSKLTLNAETLRTLSSQHLDLVVGGRRHRQKLPAPQQLLQPSDDTSVISCFGGTA